MNYTENMAPLFLIILVCFFAVLALYFKVIKPFSQDRAYIKMEMNRAFDEKEYRYWKRQLKKLYISYIPFVGSKLAKLIK